MDINAINSTPSINFKVNSKWVYSKSNEPLFKTTTSALRTDLNWREYIYRIYGKYKDCNKVNVMIHACSNGLEAYSFLLALLHLKPQEAEKFCPIIAKDIFSENIEQAKSGRFEVSTEDIARINNFTDYQINKYFDVHIRNSQYYLKPKKELSDKIIFEQGDIFNDIENLSSENSILHCRNFWAYLKPEERNKLAMIISEKFKDDTSTLVLGDYDFNNCDTDRLLDHYGFEEDLTVKNVYSKRGQFGRFSSVLY